MYATDREQSVLPEAQPCSGPHEATEREGKIIAALPSFPVAALHSRALLRRYDTKAMLPRSRLADLLARLTDAYGVLRAANRPVASYESVYFDTPELTFYHQHRRGCRPRYKVRARTYIDRSVCFLEVKRKDNRGMTQKWRMQREEESASLVEKERAFLREHAPVDVERLEPGTRTSFRRLTLVGLHLKERATFDVDLTFCNSTALRQMHDAVVVEIKQERFCPRTPVMLALREMGVKRISASKYCMGTAQLVPHVPHNCFLPALRRIQRFSNA